MNGRRARERSSAKQDQLRATLAEAQASVPVYLGAIQGGSEAWSRGRVLFVIPTLDDDYPADLKAAVDRRRRATLGGRCDCGAPQELTRSGGITIAHEGGCTATDDALDALAAAHGKTFGRWF